MRPRSFSRRLGLPILALLAIAIYGTAGYMLIEGWSFDDSLFMTVMTISTVGYGAVHNLDARGQWFTNTVMIGGVGTMLFTFGVVAEAITEGYFRDFRRRRMLTRGVQQLRQHYIICGYGRIGSQVADDFERQHQPYVVVESNATQIQRLDLEGRLYIQGDAALQEVLTNAGIGQARGLVAAVDSDERNVYITLRARTLNPKLFIIARAAQQEATDLMRHAGADRVVSPYRIAGTRMAELATRPALVEVFETIRHGDADVAVEEILLDERSPAVGRSVGELRLGELSGAHILAVRHTDGHLIVNPTAEVRLRSGDLLVALGTRDQLARVTQQLI